MGGMDNRKGLSRKIDVVGVGRIVLHSGGALRVLQDVNIHADEGEIVTLIGPSGCGKSSLLNIIAGLDDPDEGLVSVFIQGNKLVEAGNRLGEVGYMQQKDLLLPWRSVKENVLLGLEIKGIPRRMALKRASEEMADFGLDGFEDELPFTLSGGMRQRAAFLRTMLTEPEVLLLDEPFSSLDALNRSYLQEWLLGILEGENRTVVMVTHDVDEAIYLSDRIYVMSPRPGSILTVEAVPFSRPRDRKIIMDPSFLRLKSKILSSLIEKPRDGGSL